ncbi:MAG: hypothetical protein PHC54_00345 [Candidatus Omnitrophica bacterium]|nr:hypothetical protein [Candidatus Omnitrophota bacterium]MDD5591974.1 hypothetical protein [Candidatus Omnitrophota bacterium]
MELKVILLGIAVALLGYLIQVRPRFYNRYFGVDTWRNLAIADYIRTYKRLPDQLPKYMLKGPFDYPPFLNIILALLPKKFIENYQGFISPVFDALNNILVFTVTYILTRDLAVAVFAQLVYMASPLIAIENTSLNARSLGSLLFTLAFLSAVFYSINHAPQFFVWAVIFTTLLLFSQKMAAQTLFLLSLFLGLIERNPVYLVILGISVMLAIIFSRGFYIRILTGQLSVLKYFRMIIKNRYAHQVRGVIPAAKNRDFIDGLKNTIRKYPLFALAASCPLTTMGFLISLWLLIFPRNTFLMHYPGLSLITHKFVLWIVVLYGLGIITAQLGPFQFLGEGIKYLVYAVLPASFIISITVFDLFTHKGNAFLLIFIICLLPLSLAQIILLQNKAVIKDITRSVTPALRKMMDFLDEQSTQVKLATIPFSLSDCVAYFTKSDILSSDSAYVLGNNPDYLDYYPVLRRPLEEILNKHKINYLLIDKNYVSLGELNLTATNVVLEEANLCLIKR